MNPFTGKNFVATGAGSGIGAAVVSAASEAGANVWGLDVKESASANVTGKAGEFQRCDVSSESDWQALGVRASASLDGIDYLFLNAGIQAAPPEAPLSDYRFEAFDSDRYRRLIGVNIDGVVFGLHYLLPQLSAGGSIVVTGSLAGIVPYDIDPLYSMTKHAVTGLVRSLAAEMAERGLRINALCPGGIETGIIPEAQKVDGAVFMSPKHVAEEVLKLFQTDENGATWAKVSESKAMWVMAAPGRKRS